ncbi:reverse transcriptase domain-containing protein [Tanacetum coccineum]
MKSRDFSKDLIDTFYNSLNQSDQDSLNSTANGNFLTKNTQEALTIIENKSKVQTSRNKPQVSSASGSSTQDAHVIALTKQVEAFLYSMNRLVNSMQNGCETYGGPHPYYECQATGGYTQDVYATSETYNQGGNSYQPQDLMSQMQKVLHERPQGALPSNTEPNPREQVNFIMTRSGLSTIELSIPPPVPPTLRVEVEKEPKTLMDEVHITSPASTAHVPPPGIQPVSPPKPKEDHKPNPHQPKIPYPLRLNKIKLLDKNDVQVSKFLKILKQLHFDISHVDALTQIPKFTKVPEKLGDLGKFRIPCVLQDLEVCSSLADSGASINLMPLSIYEKLGIAEDVIVKVENFNFIADFFIVDFEADPRVPIILRRPFLRTARALVDLYEEKLTLRVGNEEVVFYSDKSSRNNSRDIHSVHCINIIDFSKDKMISGNPTPSSDSVVESPSLSPIPYGDSDSLVEETDTLFSHIDDSFPEYETFCFDMEEKSSGSTTTYSDYSLLDYDAFYFDDDHIEEKSSGSTTTHSDFSLLEYDSFIFNLSIDPFPPVDRSAFIMRSSPMNLLTSYLH